MCVCLVIAGVYSPVRSTKCHSISQLSGMSSGRNGGGQLNRRKVIGYFFRAQHCFYEPPFVDSPFLCVRSRMCGDVWMKIDERVDHTGKSVEIKQRGQFCFFVCPITIIA